MKKRIKFKKKDDVSSVIHTAIIVCLFVCFCFLLFLQVVNNNIYSHLDVRTSAFRGG